MGVFVMGEFMVVVVLLVVLFVGIVGKIIGVVVVFIKEVRKECIIM